MLRLLLRELWLAEFLEVEVAPVRSERLSAQGCNSRGHVLD
jgi:hypothetical protein